jgi:predicted  nucleic acid-binding Zn-ribbon protein
MAIDTNNVSVTQQVANLRSEIQRGQNEVASANGALSSIDQQEQGIRKEIEALGVNTQGVGLDELLALLGNKVEEYRQQTVAGLSEARKLLSGEAQI